MTSVKISALPAATALDGGEIVPIVQNGVTVGAAASLFADAAFDTSNAIACVDLAALKALTTRPEAVIVETGQAKGVWQWELASSTTADDALVVTPTSGTAGRYKRIYDGPIKGAWFGVDTGSSDNSTALGAAIAAVNVLGGVLELPSGTLTFTAKVTKTLTNKVTLRGAGSNTTILLWTNSDGGLDITFSDVNEPPRFEALSLQSSFAGGGTALKIQAPTSGGVGVQGLLPGPGIDDVTIGPSGAGYWTGGVHLLDAWYPSIRRFGYRGKVSDGALTVLPFASTFGVKYERTQALFMQDFVIFHAQTGVLQAGTTQGEGLNASIFEVVGVADGFDLTSFAGSAVAITGIHDGHINSYRFGINALHIVQAVFSNLLMIKTHVSQDNYVGMNITASFDNRITDNYFEDSQTATGTYTPIVLSNAATTGNTVSGNVFDNFLAPGFGIVLNTGVHDNIITDNITGSRGAATKIVLVDSGAGVGNVIRNNHTSLANEAVTNSSTTAQQIVGNSPISAQTLALNDTTPSVISSQNEQWVAAQNTNTTITALDDGVVGQRVTIFLDQYTGFTHNASTFVLLAGQNIANGAGNGHTITFECFTGKWVEIARSFSSSKLTVAQASTTNFSAVEIENTSTAVNTTKGVSYDFYGRDTINTRKLVGRIGVLPNDENWSGGGAGGLVFSPETGDGAVSETIRMPAVGGLLSNSPAGGIGYTTGAGGTIAQGSGSGKATTVVLNTVTGLIMMDGATLNADTTVSFTLTNSAIAATDTLILNHASGGTVGSYLLGAQAGAGSAVINVRNITPGNLTESPVIRFTVIKSVSA